MKVLLFCAIFCVSLRVSILQPIEKREINGDQSVNALVPDQPDDAKTTPVKRSPFWYEYSYNYNNGPCNYGCPLPPVRVVQVNPRTSENRKRLNRKKSSRNTADDSSEFDDNEMMRLMRGMLRSSHSTSSSSASSSSSSSWSSNSRVLG